MCVNGAKPYKTHCIYLIIYIIYCSIIYNFVLDNLTKYFSIFLFLISLYMYVVPIHIMISSSPFSSNNKSTSKNLMLLFLVQGHNVTCGFSCDESLFVLNTLINFRFRLVLFPWLNRQNLVALSHYQSMAFKRS